MFFSSGAAPCSISARAASGSRNGPGPNGGAIFSASSIAWCATLSAEGYYAYRCMPHAALGMVGLIQVGEPGAPDPAIADGLPGKGKTRMQELVVEAQGQ